MHKTAISINSIVETIFQQRTAAVVRARTSEIDIIEESKDGYIVFVPSIPLACGCCLHPRSQTSHPLDVRLRALQVVEIWFGC